MAGKKYLVLGGNGFIGKNLCEYIARLGHDVTSFDREDGTSQNANIKFVKGDFFNDEFLKELVENYDVIYHAISTINPGNSVDRYMNGYQNDLIQTLKLCSWIKDSDKCLVFLSSGGTVYGEQEVQPIAEQTLPMPINHYGNVKLCIENALRIFHIQNAVNIRIARISNPFGPGQDYTKGVGFVDAVLKRAIEGQVVEIWGDGNNVRDYIYIDDVCYYLFCLTEYMGEEIIFNISSGRGISQNQILDAIREMGLEVKVEYKDNRCVDVRKIILDNRRIAQVCDKEITTFEEGLHLYYKYLSTTL